MKLAQTTPAIPTPATKPAPTPATGASRAVEPAETTIPAQKQDTLSDIDWTMLLNTVRGEVEQFFSLLLSTPTLLQLFIILVLYVIAARVAAVLMPPLEERLRQIESQPQLMRALVIPLRRTKWIIFSVMLWLSAIAINQITWASRSYYVGIAATLVAAWVIISVVSRLIRNRLLANMFASVAWTVAALNVIGLLDETITVLDNAAINIGDFRLSLLLIIKGVLVIATLLWIATVLSNFTERRIRQHDDLAPTLQVLLSKMSKFVLLTVALLTGLSMLGINLTALTVFSGTLGLGLGFGLQKVVSNLISGIIILMDRSIKPGDVISLGDTFGWINSLRGRYVSVITRDGVEYLIPNESFVTEEVVNWSFSSRDVRQEVRFGVSYDANPHEVRKIAVEAVEKLDRVLGARAPVCHLTGFGDSSLDFVLRFWIADPANGLTNIKGAVLLALWDAFEENGIGIPYPHRELLISDPIRIETGGTVDGRKGAPPKRSQKQE